jgi:hypothetical protein
VGAGPAQDPLSGKIMRRILRKIAANGAVQAGARPAMVLPADGQDRPFDALDVFERCVAQAAEHLGIVF